jgi:uncharacterized protein involved in outer membrane biogenesis
VRWRRTVLIAAAALVALVAVVIVVTLERLDTIVQRAIETRGSALTQTAVRVGSLHISLLQGAATLQGLSIANPAGFTAPYAFELGEISVRIAVSSLFSDPLVIEEIAVDSPQVTCELDAQGTSNVDVIRRAVEQSAHRATGGGTPGPAERHAPATAERRLIIERLALHDGEVSIDARAVGGPQQRETLPGFELTDIGTKHGGATPAEVGRIVVTALARDVAVAVAATQVERYLGKALGGSAGDLLKKGGSEAIRKNLGNALDKLLGH